MTRTRRPRGARRLVLLLAVLAAGRQRRRPHRERLRGRAAGAEATVTLQPTHGCGGVADGRRADPAPDPAPWPSSVDGWTAAATPDGAGNTVLEWSGGELPADEDGAFPVRFTAPDAAGHAADVPGHPGRAPTASSWHGSAAIRTPSSRRPRVLVLAAGSPPAATIDDVPLDAPGANSSSPSSTSTTAATPRPAPPPR